MQSTEVNPELIKNPSTSFEENIASTTANSSSRSANKDLKEKKWAKEINWFKSTEYMHMLPATPKIYWDTKWIEF